MTRYAKSISYRFAHASKLHRARASGLLAPIGLYPGQECILNTLKKGGARSMGELAEALSVRPPTVTKMVNRLAAQGLVERARNGDGRMMKVRLTDLGASRAREIKAIWRELDKKTLKGLRRRDKKRLRRLLKKMARNLAKNLSKNPEPLAHHDNDEFEPLSAQAL